MKLSDFDTTEKADRGSFLHLEHPASGALLYEDVDKTEPVGLLLLGADSDKFRKMETDIRRKRQERLRFKGQRVKGMDPEVEDEENLRMIASCVMEIRNITDDEGEPLDSDVGAVVQMFRRNRWMFEQADRFIADRGNYLGE